MSISVNGFLLNFKRKSMAGIMEDDNGNPLTDFEARSYLKDCQAKGWVMIPTSSQCTGFDHFGGGCKGHRIFECDCGWEGIIEEMIYHNDNGEGWVVDAHECPKCRSVLQNNLQRDKPSLLIS
jgi:hypothetical protein